MPVNEYQFLWLFQQRETWDYLGNWKIPNAQFLNKSVIVTNTNTFSFYSQFENCENK